MLLLLVLCSSFACKSNAVTRIVDSSMEPMELFVNNVIVTGDFYINKNNGVNIALPITHNAKYYLETEFVNERICVNVSELSGRNLDSIHYEITECKGESSPYSANDRTLTFLGLDVSTISENKETITISKIALMIGDTPYTINSDVTIHVEPDCEFIQSDTGSILLHTFGKTNKNAMLEGVLSQRFSHTFMFNDADMYLHNDADQVTIDSFYFAHKDSLTVSNMRYAFNDPNNAVVSDGEINESFSSNLNMILMANLQNTENTISYFTVLIDYHFSYDYTNHKTVLGLYVTLDGEKILNGLKNA